MSADDGRFPPGFRWGTATAAHQIEGGNVNNDWWAWEHAEGSPCVEPSGDACDSWHRWDEDLRLVAGLGFGTYRFSLEWSRIEPEPGEWSAAALDHYRRICAAARELGVAPVVTFHHFTSPRWLAADGGWTNPATVERFARFCERAAGAVADLTEMACTINEPNIVAFVGHRLGVFPPGATDHDTWMRANDVLVAAHGAGRDAIKSVRSDLPTGLTLSMADYQATPAGDTAAERKRAQILADMEDVFLDAATADDYLGVQTYTRTRVGHAGTLGPEEGVPVLPMGYELWPEALEATIRRAWAYLGGRVPLVVTENGIGTDDDDQRIDYVRRALTGVLRCLDDGIDVGGYTYWSLMDNFEWAFGYGPRFGLVAVDRTTFERTPKPSAVWLGNVARSGRLGAT